MSIMGHITIFFTGLLVISPLVAGLYLFVERNIDDDWRDANWIFLPPLLGLVWALVMIIGIFAIDVVLGHAETVALLKYWKALP